MRTKRLAAVAALVAGLAVVSSGCGHKSGGGGIVGRWQGTITEPSGRLDPIIFDFRPDGTDTVTRTSRVTMVVDETYTITDDKITMSSTHLTVNGVDTPIRGRRAGTASVFKIDGDRMSLAMGDAPSLPPLILTRVKP